MSLFKFKNAQEYYNALVQTSANGGFPAKDPPYGFCKYRTIDGKACVIGIGIPDEQYNKSLEGPLDELRINYPKLLPEWATFEQLQQLQKIHDNLSHLKEWNHEVFILFLNDSDLFKPIIKLLFIRKS